jgi:acyl-coenzyme A synthetase/AMP-(fatty) acid ligase
VIGRTVEPATIAVRTSTSAFTFADLTGDVFDFRAQVALGGAAVLRTADAAQVASAFAVLDGWASEVHLTAPDATSAPAGVSTVLEPMRGGEQRAVSHGHDTQWVLYTSGTTGEPKPVGHSLESLTRTVNPTAGAGLVWGLLYDPTRMAGIQVLLQGMLSGSTVVAPTLDAAIGDRVAMLMAHGVDALSATPTLWRQILQLPSARNWALAQITLGGEIADQRVLDALAATYPNARIVHVFASTETGAAFSVRDGREGFPVDYLEDPPRGVQLQVRDDVLHVWSPGATAAGEDGFASTGDIVEVSGDRVLFRGRGSGVVNIGGANVWPEVVESILRRHDDVLEAVVTSKPNAMTGNVLVADVVLADGAVRDDVSKRLRAWVREQAPRTHVPATISVVDDLVVSPTGKVTR